jgi:hypothetical protein
MPPNIMLKLLSIMTQGNMRRPHITRTQQVDTSAMHECIPTKQQRHTPTSMGRSSLRHYLHQGVPRDSGKLFDEVGSNGRVHRRFRGRTANHSTRTEQQEIQSGLRHYALRLQHRGLMPRIFQTGLDSAY